MNPAEDRVQPLLSTLDRAKALIRQVARADSPYSCLALDLLAKSVREVDDAVRLVERAHAAGKDARREGRALHAAEIAPIPVPVLDGVVNEPRRIHEQVTHPARPIDLVDSQDSASSAPPRAAYPTPRGGGRRFGVDEDLPHEDERRSEQIKRLSSADSRRELSPPPALARERASSSRASSVKPSPHSPPSVPIYELDIDLRSPDLGGAGFASSHSASGRPRVLGPPRMLDEGKVDHTLHSGSRSSSRVFSPPLPSAPPADKDEPAPQARRRDDRRRDSPHESTHQGSPSAREKATSRPKPRDETFARPKSRSSATSSRHEPISASPPRRPSSRSRFETDSSDGERGYRASHHDDAAEGTGRRRSGSIGGPAARSHSGRLDDTRRALELASAPPLAEPPVMERRPPVMLGENVPKAVADAVAAQLDTKDGQDTLLALSLVSKEYHEAATAVLYRSVTIASMGQLDALTRSLDNNSALGKLVHSLTIRPLDAHLPTPSPESLVAPVKALLDRLPSLTSLDEDFTAGEWDVRELETGREYPLTVSSPAKLIRFRSAKNWWEIGALFSLLQAQPALVDLVLGGAAMDRDWAGSRLLASLGNAAPPPAHRLESLEVAQLMHEETLAVLLCATGGGHGGRLRSVRVGWQSIGSTDDDTPRASIPSAFAHVGTTLTHLALTAPTKASDDTVGLVDEVVAVLPRLEVLEWSEATELAPLPLATSELVTRLPRTLRVLRARALVSLSTSSILALLYKPEALPALRVVDVRWAHGLSGADEGKEPWFKERHLARIQDAAAELGIECTVGKGDEPLVFSRT
ncbi:hypothetical protein JCM3770_006389 [Rhodotorula araucariae]